jgi:dTDP-4-amino-4,6-dideoxygalactose transaminase
MKVPYLNLQAEFDTQPVLDAAAEQLRSCKFVGGPAVATFEEQFARVAGARFAIGVNSGTDAIFLVLKALGIGQDDEVITAPNSFIASAGAIAATGATPVFADVGHDYQLDPERVTQAVTSRTKAILPVHLTGYPADMDRIADVASSHGLAVIEDAAQAIGATYKGRKAGSLATAGCFSLHPLKSLNVAGDGGVITTDREELRDQLLLMRNHGLVGRDEAQEFGYNSRLDSIQAAIGTVVIGRLEEILSCRRAFAARYDARFAELAPHVTVPPRASGYEGAVQVYVVQCERREELQDFLKDSGIDSKIHYPRPIHLMTCGRKLGYNPGDFPVCEAQSARILSLPVNHHLSMEHIDYVTERIAAFYGGAA